MRLLHTAAKTNATFDDPNLVSHAGLVPAVRLASNVGLEELVTKHVHVVTASPEGVAGVAPYVVALADAEGLPAHADSARWRTAP